MLFNEYCYSRLVHTGFHIQIFIPKLFVISWKSRFMSRNMSQQKVFEKTIISTYTKTHGRKFHYRVNQAIPSTDTREYLRNFIGVL